MRFHPLPMIGEFQVNATLPSGVLLGRNYRDELLEALHRGWHKGRYLRVRYREEESAEVTAAYQLELGEGEAEHAARSMGITMARLGEDERKCAICEWQGEQARKQAP